MECSPSIYRLSDLRTAIKASESGRASSHEIAGHGSCGLRIKRQQPQPPFHQPDKIRCPKSEPRSQLLDELERWESLPSLEQTDEGSVDVATQGQGLLTQALFLPKAPHGLAEADRPLFPS